LIAGNTTWAESDEEEYESRCMDHAAQPVKRQKTIEKIDTEQAKSQPRAQSPASSSKIPIFADALLFNDMQLPRMQYCLEANVSCNLLILIL